MGRISFVVVFLISLIGLPGPALARVPAVTASCVGATGPGIPSPTNSPAKLAGFHASWWGQSGYPTLCPGEKSTATVAFYNSGSNGWVAGKMGEAAYLGTWGPEPGQDRVSPLGGDGTGGSPATGWPRFNRVAAQPSAYVGPGQVAWFQFALQAPMTPGVYFLGLRPLIEGASWMEDAGVFWLVTVLNPDGTAPSLKCLQCWPLSGMPIAGADVNRRPISVKLDNSISARPHWGLSLADMVWETLVEGNITRLNAVYHAQDPSMIGAVRSGRLFDRYLTPSLRGALAYSGATIEELAFFRQDVAAGLYADIGAATGAGNSYYRVNFRPTPYNLFTSMAALRSALGAQGKGGGVQVPAWEFSLPLFEAPQEANGMLGSVPASALAIPYRGVGYVRYEYQAGARGYARFQNGVREVDALNGQAIAAKTVVVIQTDVFPAQPPIVQDIFGSLGLDMRTTGTGKCSIFQQGRRQDCTWSRASIGEAFTFTNFYGKRILLSPGQTWLHVVPADWQIPSS